MHMLNLNKKGPLLRELRITPIAIIDPPLLNAAGLHAATFLLLAKECGVDVDEHTLQSSLRHVYRFAGHGNVAYGDHLPEGGFAGNGKTEGLAFTMQAAGPRSDG